MDISGFLLQTRFGQIMGSLSTLVFLSVKGEKSPCLTKILQESNEIQKAKSQHSSYMKSTLSGSNFLW